MKYKMTFLKNYLKLLQKFENKKGRELKKFTAKNHEKHWNFQTKPLAKHLHPTNDVSNGQNSGHKWFTRYENCHAIIE